MKYIASVSFGKDSLAMLLLLIENRYDLDEVIFYDTGMEFQAIYNIRDIIRGLLKELNIKYTELKPNIPFIDKMLNIEVHKRDGTIQYGYGLCGGRCRWGTTEKNKTIVIFQPHRYSRINFLLNEFKGSFEGVDEVILMPVYSAGEKNDFGVTLEKLKEKIGHNHCRIIEKNEDIEKIVADEKGSATFLFMGAGNISNLAHTIADNIGRTGNEII